jgi:hypothetical protein
MSAYNIAFNESKLALIVLSSNSCECEVETNAASNCAGAR